MTSTWKNLPLSDVADIASGLWTGKKGELVEARVLRNANFTKDSILDFSEVATIPVEVKQLESRRLEKGDLILEKSGGGPKQAVGRVVEFNLDESGFSYSNFTARIRVKDESMINSKFLQRYLWHFHMSGGTVPLQSNSTGIRNLSMSDYKNIPIPLPPLDEQKRIVAKLDESLGALDQIAESLAQREALAKKALSETLGLLLEPSINSELAPLSEMATLKGRIGWRGLTAKEYTESGPYFLSVHSLNHGHKVDFSQAFHISEDRYKESPEIMLQPEDILICKDGAGIGKVGIIDDIPGPSTVNSSLLVIRANHDVLPKYLYYYLLGPRFQKIIQTRLSGSTTPHLYQRDIAELPIRKMPTTKQKKLLERLDLVADAMETLPQIFDKMKNELSALRGRILSAAFAGDF